MKSEAYRLLNRNTSVKILRKINTSKFTCCATVGIRRSKYADEKNAYPKNQATVMNRYT